MKKSLTELRSRKNITQAEMAEILGILISTYNMYEHGQRKIP
ncbi:helix-turn-helix transcriptional regulator [Lutispora thermophila]|uniref:Helix-turn-helix transcriptional regulator n=1 Tax=Lutispora saccharofermentans TaxID=3024236 RepID=A0ABT1NDG8_9FIRM|nr:helix-turn-helix transcriptional regulator [Lutispora saccharofermentans]